RRGIARSCSGFLAGTTRCWPPPARFCGKPCPLWSDGCPRRGFPPPESLDRRIRGRLFSLLRFREPPHRLKLIPTRSILINLLLAALAVILVLGAADLGFRVFLP